MNGSSLRHDLSPRFSLDDFDDEGREQSHCEMARFYLYFVSFLAGFACAFWGTFLKSLLEINHELRKPLNAFQIPRDRLSIDKCNYGPRGPRILCAVLTHEKYLKTRAEAVANTWAKRCDLTLFIAGDSNSERTYSTSNAFGFPNLRTVFLKLKNDTYEELTEKTIQTLVHAYEFYLEDFDWLIKADDDTYVVVDNLRTFLKDKCPDQNLAYGRIFEPRDLSYLAGGSGYCLSRETVRKFGHEMERHGAVFCSRNTKFEDIDIALCLKRLGTGFGDSRDQHGRDRFHPLRLDAAWQRNDTWLQSYSKYEARLGKDCCSDTSISFHHMQPHHHYLMDYLVYSLKTSDRE